MKTFFSTLTITFVITAVLSIPLYALATERTMLASSNYNCIEIHQLAYGADASKKKVDETQQAAEHKKEAMKPAPS